MKISLRGEGEKVRERIYLVICFYYLVKEIIN